MAINEIVVCFLPPFHFKLFIFRNIDEQKSIQLETGEQHREYSSLRVPVFLCFKVET